MTSPGLFVLTCLFIGEMSPNVIYPKFYNMRKYFVVEGIHAGIAKAISDASEQAYYHAISQRFHVFPSFLRSILHIVA